MVRGLILHLSEFGFLEVSQYKTVNQLSGAGPDLLGAKTSINVPSYHTTQTTVLPLQSFLHQNCMHHVGLTTEENEL